MNIRDFFFSVGRQRRGVRMCACVQLKLNDVRETRNRRRSAEVATGVPGRADQV